MRQAWRGLAGLLAIGVFATGGSVALADGGGGHDGNGNGNGALATPTIFTMPAADGPPEGVAFDKKSGQFFVSRTGTGAIFSGTLDNTALQPFLPGGASTGSPLATGLKVRKGLLYVAGASTGKIVVVNLATKAVVATFDTRTVNDPAQPSFINDLDVTKDGDVFATDSNQAFIYKIPAAAVAAGGGAIEAIKVSPEITVDPAAFNLNGIVASHDGDELIVVQSNTGQLWRVTAGDNANDANDDNDDHGGHGGHGGDHRARAAQAATPAARTIAEITVDGGPLTGGDGLLNDRGRLLVVRGSTPAHANGAIDVVKLRGGDTRGEVENEFSDPSLTGPSTVARAGNLLLVVNPNFAGAAAATQFTVSGISRNAVRGHGGHGGDGGGGNSGGGHSGHR